MGVGRQSDGALPLTADRGCVGAVLGASEALLVPATGGTVAPMPEIPTQYRGWWRIVETSRWVNDDIDICGAALNSLTGYADRLRMFVLLAYVNCKPTKAGVSFTWEGAWEFDQVSGTGSVRLGKDGRLKGKIKIKDGDDSTFIAERAEEPAAPIADPPNYRDKWKRR